MTVRTVRKSMSVPAVPAARMQREHMYVAYVVTHNYGTGNAVHFTDMKEAHDYYSATPNAAYHVEETSVECALFRKVNSREFCSHCAECSYTIDRWTDEIGSGLIRCNVSLPNHIGDRKAQSMLNALSRVYGADKGVPEVGHRITGGASINTLKLGYTVWRSTYAPK